MKFNQEMTFGVEIEVAGDWSDSDETARIAQALRSAGISAQYDSYGHSTRDYWKVIYDSSCGHEIVSPILRGDAGLDELEKVCTALQNAGCRVNSHCGFHVHHGIQHLSQKQIRNIYLLAIKWERVVDRLVAPSRRGNENEYARSISHNAKTLREVQSCMDILTKRSFQNFRLNVVPGRFYKVNPESFSRHGTIEFRQHQGTLDFDKMRFWIIMTQNFVTRAMRSISSKLSTESSISFKRFCDWIGVTGKYVENNYHVIEAVKTLKDRWNHFNGKGDKYQTVLEIVQVGWWDN